MIVAFYCWTATSSSDASDWEWGPKSGELPAQPGPENYYNLLASGFLAGHLYLPIEPSQQLLAVKNPYGEAGVGRLQDASLYKGKYYLYYGPTPALTLFLPWRVLSGRGMPHSFAVLAYATAGYVFSCLLLFLLLEAADIHVSRLLKGAAVMALGLGNLTLLLVRRPGAVYEVAIMAGSCFFMAAMYLLARGVTVKDNSRWVLVAAGCCAGLSAGCRPHYGVVSAVVLAMYAAYVLRAGRLRELLWFGTPVVVCGLALAWYNFARFDNPLELGTNYQLTGNSVAHVMLHARHVVPTLYFYFFSQPQWMNQFPFLQLMRPEAAPFGRPDWMPWINLEEEFAGILTIAPLCAAGLVLPLALLRKSADWRAVKLVVFALWGAALIMLASIAFAGEIAMRYHPDYAPELLVAALFVCLWAVSAAQSRARRTIAVAVTVMGCVWSTGCTMALSINGYNHSLRTRNPAQFRSLVSFFGGDPSAIRYPVRQLKFAATMTLPGGAGRSSREAILSAGSGEAGDVVFVEYTGRNRLRFGVQHAGQREVLGPEVEYTAEAPLDFLLDYERTDYGRLTVRLAGQTVLFRQGEMCFTAPAEIAVGHDKRGSGGMPRFSGQLAINDGVSLVFGE